MVIGLKSLYSDLAPFFLMAKPHDFKTTAPGDGPHPGRTAPGTGAAGDDDFHFNQLFPIQQCGEKRITMFPVLRHPIFPRLMTMDNLPVFYKAQHAQDSCGYSEEPLRHYRQCD